MEDRIRLREAEKVEILTLQDNYVDVTVADNSAVISRAAPLKAGEFRNSVLAEHGFSAVVKVTIDGRVRTLLFDFGFSEFGAAYNAKVLGEDMSRVEVLALSHGHSDHTGGFERLVEMVGREGIELFLHPAVYKTPRYLKLGGERKIYFPEFTRTKLEKAGVKVVEARKPGLLLDGAALFLGEIPRRTDFEKGFPIAHFQEGGVEKWDPIEDDTSIVMQVKGKGLVVLSGCAHSGIVNTALYAREVTGVDQVHVIMGGFHLSGPAFEPIIGRTTEELKKINPAYIVPTHCTGRRAIMHMEQAMPDKFILNMSGTRLTFSA
ncbi:MAG: MBL fold metallo-hydrolase [Syntrophobacterales bacterium]|nr:MBL fold metallo-hydrolase [Syntrophobacterales bacterium]